MRNRSKIKISIITFGIVFALLTISSFNIIEEYFNEDGVIENRDESNLTRLKRSADYTENFIHIDGSIPGNWTDTTGYPWCYVENGVYIIENVTIDASTSPTGSGIFINNSKTEYFIIRNCTVYNTGSTGLDGGIKLENTDNGTLILNNCSNNGFHGIFLYRNCKNNTILGNIAKNKGTTNQERGIYLQLNCDNNTISGNTANENLNNGIYLYDDCDNNIISNNTASNIETANQDRGINLNTGCDNNIVTGNNVNNNTEYGIYIRIDCAENEISRNNVTGNNLHGIYLFNECDKNTISRNTVIDNNKGIYLYFFCDNNTISGNNARNNVYGIQLEDHIDRTSISGNTAIDNSNGIFLYTYCDHNNISGNTATNNYYGINIYTSRWNNISENTLSNIGTVNQNFGIALNEGYENFILGNTINKNYQDGITIRSNSNDNTIIENFIFDNFDYGIQLEADCHDNLILYNYFVNNSDSNAYDLGFNDWDNGIIGNYWDDYSGVDADYNGIGDTPYTVSGGAGNKDNNPIMIYKAFFYESSSDLTYEVGVEGNSIKWIIINPFTFPLNFNIFRDGTSIKTGQVFPLRKSEISINVDGLSLGIHGFTIEVADGNGGTFTDGVWVTVTNIAPLFTATPVDFSYEAGDVGNNLSWTFSDLSTDNPSYTITRDGVPIITNNPCVSDVPIEISVDGLSVGTYGFIIEVNDGYDGTALDGVWVTVTSSSDSTITNLIYVDIVDQSFSDEEFNIAFFICSESGQRIDSTTIQTWWNGNDVSDDVVNLGNGLYFVSLEPITVAPGEDPILLKMIISATGYEDKEFETYLAVDPNTLVKEAGKGAGEVPLVIILIAIISTAAGIAVATTTVVLLRKRKRVNEV